MLTELERNLDYLESLTKKTFPRHWEDLLQMTCLKILRNKNKFRRGTNFKAWARRVMINTKINYIRKEMRAPKTFSGLAPDEFDQIEKEKTKYRFDIYEFDKGLMKRIDGLPQSYKDTLKLRLQGYKIRETAKRLGLPDGTVLSRMYRIARIITGKDTYIGKGFVRRKYVSTKSSKH